MPLLDNNNQSISLSLLEQLKILTEPRREFCYGKIHRCVVTHADLHYVGSITVDSALLRAARILPYTKVEVVNISRKDAARIMTYVIEGKENSGIICLNGAAAHHFNRGDLAIIMAYEDVPVSQIPHKEHVTVQVNGEIGIVEGKTNKITTIQSYKAPDLCELGAPQNNRFAEVYKETVKT
ncbi:MAG: aspartate 1-decarboxylase [Alphaproteobacteria bacterium]|nr:aspartate 1-decarboxylase [Alphaproteobacteria bacterium]MCK5556543.1 aspartate 1-decarboxylase [Alphaproteobacteria bacterium]MCK5659180.1 aspartate 1-decarboxylase [Alphaproteobacteria bacterium]